MTCCSAVGVNDDLTSCKSSITLRSADYETSCRIDVDLGVVINQGSVNNRIDNVLSDILVDLLLSNLLIMLS